MELTAIYHRPESEYAYLYKDKTMHIRIRTKKDDIESINLHYGDPFIFIEDRYEAIKEMRKLTSDALFDYWQVEVTVGYARLQYLFELKDKQGQSILYGDKGCVENTLENLHYEGNGFKLPYIHELMLVMYLTGFQRRSGTRFFQNASQMEILRFLQRGL